ncbi:MAG TPA: sulfate adenylyltransferase subunit CysN [Methylococcaceae bacterium]|jgi:sulfate adenylyltransferase large subunit|nr:sulfate adenylyltransferase subunit CysN [Methylococcaceae bacterium]HIN68564.1 sulfate adenylyltransferase subunit CysN [Methylococcales bacterium]HIA45738.1 sulfate adenylyltransferase subunit CysN [Methylococcaceae bacterium]HIB62845.1 sulfate adenylyltransferase subunit CysN [Methylococcaceae bacterium]HIO12203.1 sulfate adenylyltransferase subunit CysN [Methylococcales bacterium]
MSHQSELISTDINAYLAQHERKELLRLLTCGSVDDGKSTLIGRLLYDSKMIYEDQLAAITADSQKSGTTGDQPDLALLVDGLQSEREQGITIDVAYRYFSTSKRKFIIADTPGHEQYTRNMATGASTCDLAIILIDARYGVKTQTKRHSYIASLLGIKHIIVAINKMDLMNYDEAVFNAIKSDFLSFSEQLRLTDIIFMPMSALKGDNVVHQSTEMPWFSGQPLMATIENVEIANDRNYTDTRFPIQYVNRPNLDFRGFCGTIASGVFNKGDQITALPSGKTSTIKSIVTYDGDLEKAFPPMAVTMTLTDEIDISRGDMIVLSDQTPSISDHFKAEIVWMTETAMVPGKQYLFKCASRSVSGSISSIHYRTDVNTLAKIETNQLNLNEIGTCSLAVNAPIVFDTYKTNQSTGAFIIIDRLSNVTVGAGMITESIDSSDQLQPVSMEEKAARFSQQAMTINITGNNHSNLAYQLERRLFDTGHAATVLEGDSAQNAAYAQLINQSGLICICASQEPVQHSQLEISATTETVKTAFNRLKTENVIN